MRLWDTLTTSVNNFSVQHDGYVGISNVQDFFNQNGGHNPAGPFSRLHLADSTDGAPGGYAQTVGFRGWMKNGITFTGNYDQGYIGQKYNGVEVGNDSTDMVIQWSDNPGEGAFTPDHLRFIFTSNYSASRDTGAKSLEGLEAMRFFPVDSFNVNVGVGDFWKASVFQATSVEPEERLDMVDGRLRIRQLPNDPNTHDEKVMVVADDGVVHWRPMDDFHDAIEDCEWVVNSGTGPGDNSMYTAYGSETDECPDETEFVGIGTNAPAGKLHVVNEVPDASWNYGTLSEIPGATGSYNNYAVAGTIRGDGDECVGVYGTANITDDSGPYSAGTRGYMNVASDVEISIASGVRGDAVGNASGGFMIGVRGEAKSYDEDGDITTNIGVYGLGIGNSDDYETNYGVFGDLAYYTGSDDWAIWANGPAGGTSDWQVSDQSLKTNIEPLTGAMDVIEQLDPKTFEFRTDEFPEMHLEHGTQMGLIAQQVEQVWPASVKQARLPQVLDSMGVEIAPAHTIKLVNYDSFIALLIAAVQEQQEQIGALENALSECCTEGRSSTQGSSQQSNAFPGLKEERLTISPNPFTTRTTLSYYMPANGRVKLEVSDADGRGLTVLREEVASEGEYSYDWNTTNMAAGTYFVSLVVDDNVIVKRAVKVNER